MRDAASQMTWAAKTSTKVAMLLSRRLQHANEQYRQRLQEAGTRIAQAQPRPQQAMTAVTDTLAYAIDATQRSILVADTLRERGNNFIAHEQAGKPPLLHFDYQVVLDARGFERPVNYALVRIIPPAGVKVDPGRRPYVIIDPRAGHGPGIGGFKDDSQVGVALADGHPVYFVIFYPDPEPGQTLLDVTEAQRKFVAKVRELHPGSRKPAIVGNCQGGWAAMMLAAADPDATGPIVINGAPMSYWGGAWTADAGDNPMRYAGGLLGGSWLSSLTADLANGVFDGAHLVQNFENLNPANTFWDKYYHLYANADSEPPRFLDFERWWGGFYLMNREEIEWIVRNLFVGNTLWREGIRSSTGEPLDLRRLRVPIVLFASMGDNITPPQQAFNWVGDVYGSTEEIKARGQTIVGLLHQDVGHLGIFVSGKVAKKEHRQIVSVLESIEALPPGLWGMQIAEAVGRDGKPTYDVQFIEHRLEEVAARLNRFARQDEKAFEAVATISEFNQRAYELFARPLMQAIGNEYVAQVSRTFHPLRVQRWSWSDFNPWMSWVGPAAQWVRASRTAVGSEAPARTMEAAGAAAIGASLDYCRQVRDALSEATFFQVYGSFFGAYLADGERPRRAVPADARELPYVQEALANIRSGGFAAAVARAAVLLARRGTFLPLARLSRNRQLIEEYADVLPAMTPDHWRRLRGEQEIVVDYAPQDAIATLPDLLSEPGDRARFGQLFERLLEDPRIVGQGVTEEQQTMLTRIDGVLGAGTAHGARRRRRAARGSTARGASK
ncbi:MAG: DUF3141 domain-containing protein [Burkholderiales bacterium]|nr:MAG: DUF3141 domain-containing protein [Burkholderiales bacterium]